MMQPQGNPSQQFGGQHGAAPGPGYSAGPGYGPPPGYGPAYGGGPGYGGPAYGGGPGYGPGYGPSPGARQPLRPLGPILMLVGALATIVALFLPWLYDYVAVDAPDGGIQIVKGESVNAFGQIEINQHAGRVYGTLMLIAVIVALLACVMVIIAALGTLLVRPRGNGLGILAIVGAILGLVGTLGVFIGYASLGAIHEAAFGMFIYSFAFVVVLIGAIGVVSKKY